MTVQTIEKIGRMPLIPLSDKGDPQSEVEISPVFPDPGLRTTLMAAHSCSTADLPRQETAADPGAGLA
jgi:hypothetical protein